jgi:hypothetical protein
MLLSQASASAAFHDQTATGKLKAEMMPVTPSGCQVSYMRCWLAFGGDRQAVELAGYSLTCATVSLIGVFATSVPPVRGCGYNFDHRKGSRGFPRMPVPLPSAANSCGCLAMNLRANKRALGRLDTRKNENGSTAAIL